MTSKAESLDYLRQTITLARQSPPKPTNFRVGCVIVSHPRDGTPAHVLSTGYTLELEGNTHAEQCALTKLVEQHGLKSLAELGQTLTAEMNVTLYTSLEPCGKRLSGSVPCVERIVMTRRDTTGGGIRKVVFGAKEPGTFVQDSKSCQTMTDAGVEWEFVPDLQNPILQVAMEGHNHNPTNTSAQSRTDDAREEERKSQEAMPRNPKKRMMDIS